MKAQGKRENAQWANMTEIMTSKPTGTIKDKSKVNEPWKPKERSKKPNEPT